MAHITFIHGILNKPPPARLHEIWREALAENGGIDLDARGITSSMVYWADVLYDRPESEGEESAKLEAAAGATEERPGDDASLDVTPSSDAAKRLVEGLEARFGISQGESGDEKPAASSGEAPREAFPLPPWIERRLMRVLLRDVHHYLFNATHSPRPGETYRVRDEIRRRFVGDLVANAPDDARHFVVSHSMGTVIAYDCLLRADGCPGIESLVTLGSPLGLDEVQDPLRPEYRRESGFPRHNLERDWANVYDALDVVAAFDPRIANDYQHDGQSIIRDVSQQNGGWWRHDLVAYLRQAPLRREMERILATP